MRRVNRLVVVMLVLIAPVVGASAVPASQQSMAQSGAATTAQEFDSTTFLITVQQDGSATFTIRYERRLANESEVEQFETFADRFENESTDLYENFQSRSNSLVATGRNATGREMTAGNFTRDARVQERFNTLGVVEMSFEWSNFAQAREDGQVVVGDVFEDGIYLGPNQALVFRHGDGLRFASVDPSGSNSNDTLAGSDSVTWSGEREFSDNRPRVVLAPPETVDGTTTDGGDGESGDGDGESGDGDGAGSDGGVGAGDGEGNVAGDGMGMLPMIALGLLAFLVAAFAYRQYGGDLVTGEDDDASGPAAAASEAASSETETTGGTESTEPAISDEELLTDEDRVVSLLEDHGGRMRQVNIVEETNWSKSKVSMLLSEMEDEDVISKLRVGRENIISLHGQEPDVAGSPFDDEPDENA